MSAVSSNQVRVAVIEETVLGETPVAGNFENVKFISESLSGTPSTTESQAIRTDRLSNGQVVTGLETTGDIAFELAKDSVIDLFIESAMLNEWVLDTPVNVDMEIDITAKTIERASGDWNTDVQVGDLLVLTNFTSPTNNTQVFVAEIVSATVIRYAGPSTMVDEVAVGSTFKVADKIEIGVDKKSFSMEKTFLQLSDKALIYKGMMANTMSFNIAYGEIVNASFGFVGTDYYPVDASGDFITDSRTINAQSNTQPLNGSVDMPLIISNSAGQLEGLSFCIQSAEISLDNNSNPQNCIGKAAPRDHTFNTANVSMSLSAYLGDDNWEIIEKKLTQESFSIGFQVKNGDGFYAFYVPALQVSFDDPNSGGANQDVFLEMSGVAKPGPNAQKSLIMFRG